MECIPLVTRVRDVEQAPDGSVYVLTDHKQSEVLRFKPMKKATPAGYTRLLR